MPSHSSTLLALLAALGLSAALPALINPTGAQPPDHHAATYTATKGKAPLFDNLGSYRHPISTRNPVAQRYFDQGLILAYGFNHAEAARSFEQATKIDPNCAMCYGGWAYVLGPNINAPMTPEAVPQAWRAVRKAVALSKGATAGERAYIQALAKRYTPKPSQDRKPLDLAYARAMGEVARRYPTDLDAATLYAEALMDTSPWDYWQADGQPKPQARQIIATLESVLERKSDHPGANHLYIHAVEKQRPELGVAAADRLMTLVPGAGHLVHMASHIYIRVGRYPDAVLSNQRAIQADDAYVASCHAQGIYPLLYRPHNHHFLWFAASMSGQSTVAMEAARFTAQVDPKLLRAPDLAGGLQHFSTIPTYTAVRFGKWDEILATPAPEADLKYPSGVWHYAQGRALLAKGQPDRANQHLEQLHKLAEDPELEKLKIWSFSPTGSLLKIASEVLAGELAAGKGNYDEGVSHLQKAVQMEDALVYTEPAEWYQPTRQALASILLRAGRSGEAEQAYRADLKLYPENGWSLMGLSQSLQAQGKAAESQSVQQQFAKAWKTADVTLSTSQF
ncbi:tetratricopeptide repeat protein [Gloeobacter morelensis]|nr:hypothetical protein [Gloeobacter morelensis]